MREHEIAAQKIIKYVKLQDLSKENSVFIPIFNHFISLGLQMSYFMANILANKDMYKVWVKKIGGMFLGGQNAQKRLKMLKNAFSCILTPKNTHKNFFEPNFIHFLVC